MCVLRRSICACTVRAVGVCVGVCGSDILLCGGAAHFSLVSFYISASFCRIMSVSRRASSSRDLYIVAASVQQQSHSKFVWTTYMLLVALYMRVCDECVLRYINRRYDCYCTYCLLYYRVFRYFSPKFRLKKSVMRVYVVFFNCRAGQSSPCCSVGVTMQSKVGRRYGRISEICGIFRAKEQDPCAQI